MKKAIKTLAIVAVFRLIELSGFPQEVQQEEALAVQAAQMAEGTVIRLAPGRGYWP